MIAYNYVASLINDPNNKRVFDRVAENRRVHLGELLKQVKTDRNETKRALHQLEKEKLVAKKGAPIEDYTIYYITSKGLKVKREIERIGNPAFI
ncbi:hypothetical protein [Dactylococcopsis salina]|uniref:HTH hxlR-type domain-containing protein n=1 Tax=Dactylococcopsis salina (strain PCC 8305) TaxID=13035 RepID=K9YSM0_DACS8|nr:hypothetical protein [Dactylococcopsis salina]AFZ49502.1 hypothetical protein Dacsa_0746 [Dactylococcopsis salina PCC 8305]